MVTWAAGLSPCSSNIPVRSETKRSRCLWMVWHAIEGSLHPSAVTRAIYEVRKVRVRGQGELAQRAGRAMWHANARVMSESWTRRDLLASAAPPEDSAAGFTCLFLTSAARGTGVLVGTKVEPSTAAGPGAWCGSHAGEPLATQVSPSGCCRSWRRAK